VDYLAFSFHKFYAPFGVGVLYTRERLAEESLPFLYGGDMIAPGAVSPEYVGYHELPWKFAAGTPNILGVIASAQALRWVVDTVDGAERFFRSGKPPPAQAVSIAMGKIHDHVEQLTAIAHEGIARLPGVVVYGPPDPRRRSPLVAFNVRGMDPVAIATQLDARGIESRAGCHCATLAHRALGLDPPASCRLSFAAYNTADEVRWVVDALREIVQKRLPMAS
jgi:cysteine desulfurase/selenocysteine lyase